MIPEDTHSDRMISPSAPARVGKIKSTSKMLGLLKGLTLKDLTPEAPAIANFITGEVMGHSADRLADKFGVSRHEQDSFALRSHLMAAKVMAVDSH